MNWVKGKKISGKADKMKCIFFFDEGVAEREREEVLLSLFRIF